MTRTANMLGLLDSRRLRFLLTALLRIAASSRSVSGKVLAAQLQCPARYLEPDLQSLVTGGVLQSRRGAGGGYSLARPAGRINLNDILSCLDAGVQSDVAEDQVCRLQQAVVLPLLAEAERACHEPLGACSLASFLNLAEREGLLRGPELPANFSI